MAQLSTEARAADVSRAANPLGSALLVLAGASLFGTVGTAQALGPDVPADSLAAARMLLTGIALVLVAGAYGHRSGILVALRQSPAWLAGLGQAAFNLCFLAAMQQAGVAVGTLVAIGAAPVITGLITRHVTRPWLAATTVAVVGLALLVGGQQDGPQAPSTAGVLLALGAAASYATYIVAGNAAEARGLETQSFLAAAFSVAALLTLPWLLLGDTAWIGTTGGGSSWGTWCSCRRSSPTACSTGASAECVRALLRRSRWSSRSWPPRWPTSCWGSGSVPPAWSGRRSCSSACS